MVSMGKYGGTFVRSNSRGTTQITFGSRTNQSSANGIFGQQNNTTASKNSVSDIKRMLARDSRSTQTQAANSLGQESIVTSTLSYSEALRNQRQQTKNTTLALKKLKYQFKNISSKILRSKTSQAAKQAAGQARREVLRLKRQKQSGNYDDEEIEAAINHAKAMERVAKKVVPDAPNEVLLVLDGSTGQNAFEQAKQFTLATEVTAMAITKLDGTAKGGVVIGISDQFKIPVKYIGLGEGMEDLQVFRKKEFVDSLFGENA